MLAWFVGVSGSAWLAQHTVAAADERCSATSSENEELFPANRYDTWKRRFDLGDFGWECRYYDGEDTAEILFLGWEW